jgi:predicted RNA polymerase sigma factor
VALTLRTLGGLQTKEIARAFLTSEATIGQRISRAKKTLTDKRVRFELPPAEELAVRLDAVLGVVYLIFNEGYSATSGADWTRPALCQDALRLGRMLAGLQPEQPDVHGLVALMELQASRFPARTGPAGEPVLLAGQDRRRWDQLLIRRGLAALRKAEELGGGTYTVQAAIAACHATAKSVDDTDWRRIAALYTVLAHIAPSPVVGLNRAVAVGMAEGPERGLELADQLQKDPALAGYPQLPAVRATSLQRLGHLEEARAEFERAAARTDNAGERRLYLEQARRTEQV